MGHDNFLGSVHRSADHADQLVDVLAELQVDALQQTGDAVLATIELDQTPALDDVVARLIAALDARLWNGDSELIDALKAATGSGPSLLTRVTVELDEVADALNQPGGTPSYLDIESGQVWIDPFTYSPEDEEDFEDETRWLHISGEGSSAAYRDLERFVATVEDQRLAERLDDALHGRGAFQRFRRVLEREDPAEYTRWHRQDTDRRLGRARSWLANQNYAAQPVRYRS